MIHIAFKSTTGKWAVSFVFLMSSILLRPFFDTPTPWFSLIGMAAIFYLTAGYCYNSIEKKMLWTNKTTIFILIVLLYIAGVFISNSYLEKIGLLGEWTQIKNPVVFLFLSFLGILAIIHISKYIEKLGGNSLLEYIGKNSIVYYLLNGGVITVLTIIANKFLPAVSGSIFSTIAMTVLTLIILSVANLLILRYAPWSIGKTRNKKIV